LGSLGAFARGIGVAKGTGIVAVCLGLIALVALALGVAVMGTPSKSPSTNATREPSSEMVSAPKSFALVPISRSPEAWPINRTIAAVLVFDSDNGEAVVSAESIGGALWSSWLNERELLVRIDNGVALYDAQARSYRKLNLGFDLPVNGSALVSPDGSVVAIGGGGLELVFADLQSMTFRVVHVKATPRAWSPDSSKILVLGEGGVHTVVDLANPGQPIRLPESGNYSGWLTNSRLLGMGSRRAIIADIRSPDIAIALDQVPNGGHFSPNGNYVAVTETAEGRDSESRTDTTSVYRLMPFERIATFDNTALCCTQDNSIWTSDSSHFLALRSRCNEGETLVLANVLDGSETAIARVGTSQAAISPDDRSVAFGAGGLFLVSIDSPGQQARLAVDLGAYPGGVSDPEWSPGGRYIAFTIGSFGRCP
jgi:hypothetical protein